MKINSSKIKNKIDLFVIHDVRVCMYVACRNKHPALALFLFLLYSNVFANKLRRPFAKKKLEHGNVYDLPSKRPKNEYLARSQTPIN